MGKNWSELSSEEKREGRFKRWLSPEDVTFDSPEAEALYKERVTRLIDAIKLKEPDRVPVVYRPGFIPARYAGYSVREVMYDSEKMTRAWLKFMNDFEHDTLPGASLVRSGEAMEILGSKMNRWAGCGLPDNVSPQYVEGEYLKADEWDAYRNDRSDFNLRTYLPRIYRAAEPFRKLPPLYALGAFGGGGLSAFTDPEVKAAFEAFAEAEEVETKWRKAVMAVEQKGLSSGLPRFIRLAIGIGAPLDMIGAALRGTKGMFIDMFQRPEILIEYMEDAVAKTVAGAAMLPDTGGPPVLFIPLHRGADRFMSEEQFNTFYWPYLKRNILGYIEEGFVPLLFAEGGYNSRLEIIRELPRGKVIWHFDQTDMAKAKEILGDRACIMGNVPTSLLVTGTKEDVKAYCKKLIETASPGGGYILAPGATADQAKVENLNAMLEAGKEYGVYSK
jgi:uroporphyrinogen-III decarboxylase